MPCSLVPSHRRRAQDLSRYRTHFAQAFVIRGGIVLKHKTSRELYDYWDRIRGGDPAPRRSDIEPGDIRSILADTFILEAEDRTTSLIRLAGTRMCALYGREIKGQGFFDFWSDDDRPAIATLATAVTEDEVVWTHGADRHLGGTPNIPGAIAMAKALDFLRDVGLDAIRHHEIELTRIALNELRAMDGVEVYGPADPDARLGVVSFNIDGVHHDLAAAILNNEAAIATRNGCFCAHPYLHRLLRMGDVSELVATLKSGKDAELPCAVRVSIGIFNTPEEVEYLLRWVRRIRDRQWAGHYDLDKRDYCKPVFFEFQGVRGQSGSSGKETSRV